jgi:peptidoglycan-associated lipoprotein
MFHHRRFSMQSPFKEDKTMMKQQLRSITLISALAGFALLAGCNKKVAKVTPPAPPAPPAPTATLAANPSVIQSGQSTTLTWQTTNADHITIQGLGIVASSGTRTLTPNQSTMYTLTAKGPGGTQDATASIAVNPVVKAMTPQPSEQDLFAKNVNDVYFDFNRSDIRPDEVSTTDKDGSFLAEHPHIKVTVEGHCDDRGSEEYNIALGDSRANSLKASLVSQGVSSDHIKTISYGKEKPFCSTDDEQCWQQNRRDHVVFQH